MKHFLENVRKYLRMSDLSMIAAVMAISAISCIMLFGIASGRFDERCDISTVQTQIAASVTGLFVVGLLSVLDYNKFVRLWMIYVPLAIILILLTFTSLGYGRGGDRNWLSLGPISIQPSEVLKLAFILTFSLHLARDEEHMNQLPHMLLLCLHGLAPILLVALQDDYGTAIVFIIIFMAEMLAARIALRYIIMALIAIPSGALLAWNFLLQDVHKNRILVLIHPGTDPENLEYQQDMGLAALANGGTFGQGLLGGSYINVPEMQNDFIYAFVGQAWGIVGSLVVMALLVFICLKVLVNSLNSKNRLGKFICIGTFAMLFAHCFMNIGMVLKVMPVIGIPLPFMSAGGTALLSMYTAIGIVNSTRCHNIRRYRINYDADPL